MTQSSYSLTGEALTALATAFTDQGDTLSTVLSGTAVAADAASAVVSMEEAWGFAGTFVEQRAAYLVPAEAARASLEVLAGVFRNIGQAITDLALRYQAAESEAGTGFTQVGQNLTAGGG
jgi:ABC-type transporter Mla subunit MlaD